MAMRCLGCEHSKTDHMGGRCVNAQLRFDPAVGGTVTKQCDCRSYSEQAEIAEETPPEAVSEYEAPEEETTTEEEVSAIEPTPIRRATRVRTPKS